MPEQLDFKLEDRTVRVNFQILLKEISALKAKVKELESRINGYHP